MPHPRVTNNHRSFYTSRLEIEPLDARVAELVDAADSDSAKLSPRGEIFEVKPVKLGEGPEQRARADTEPSPGQATRGRCREQTAGTYGRKAMVKACSRPRTSQIAGAAKAEVARKSAA